jgi:hypothetical protein
MAAKTGALFTSFTVTVKLLVSLRLGEPLSVTRTVTGLLLGPCDSVGVQLNTPLPLLIVIPDGAPASRLYVKVLAGTSPSLAVAVNVKVLPSLIVWLAMAAKTGALFASFTVTVKLLVSLRLGEPLSVTRTVIVFVLGPCDSLGVQLNTPLLALMLAPDGGLTKLNASVLAGTSASLAVAVSVSVLPSLIVWLAIAAKIGALFTSFTTTEKLCVALRLGEPLSATRTVISVVLGPCASVGVQLNTPLLELMLAPDGGEMRLNVSVLVGTSPSEALAVSVKVLPSLMV